MRKFLFLCVLAVAPPLHAQLLNGTYETRWFNPQTGRVEPQAKNLPPGQVRTGLIQGMRFAILDMMSGFQGPIRKKGKTYEFIFEEGPAGKSKKPAVAVVSSSPDRKTLSFKLKGKVMMIWIWKDRRLPIKLPY